MTHGKDRIFVSIAVSKPTGGLDPLPGAITAATRMEEWARRQGYKTLLLHDGELPEITVDILRDKITASIREVTAQATLARLVVFFAGHGATLDPIGDQYWILTNWHRRGSEAVKVSAFQRMLEFYGPEQVSIIGDACQEYSSRFMLLTGNAVLDRLDEDPRQYELDQFYAADVGKQAFMIKAKGEKGDFCLFTEVLLDALEGDALDSSFEEIEGYKYVTSQSLARYLKAHVALEASKYGIRMDPRPMPGFYTDRTYLSLSALPAEPPWHQVHVPGTLGATAGSPEHAPAAGPEYGMTVPPEPAVRKLRLIKSRALRAEFEANMKTGRVDYASFGRTGVPMDSEDLAQLSPDFISDCGICVSEPVQRVEALSGALSQVADQPTWFRIKPKDSLPDRPLWSDTLVTLPDSRIVHVCAINGWVAVLHIDSTGMANIFHRSGNELAPEDRYAYALVKDVYAGRALGAEIVLAAAIQNVAVRPNPMLSCVLAQYYDAVRDVDGLRSLAAAHALRQQPVPLDVILYGGGRISVSDDRLYADIPAVMPRMPLPFTDLRSRHVETPAFDKYPIAGRIPWTRAAWDAIGTAVYDKTASSWRELASAAMVYLAPGKVTTIRPEGQEAIHGLAGAAIARRRAREPVLPS